MYMSYFWGGYFNVLLVVVAIERLYWVKVGIVLVVLMLLMYKSV